MDTAPSTSNNISINNNRIRLGTQASSFNKLTSLINVISLKQSIIFLLNSSLVVKSLCFCVFIGYIISFQNDLAKLLSVVPGKLLPPNYYLWTLLTHSFIEFRLIELITDWFIILLFSKMIEPLWGTIECIQFYFIITVLVSLASSLVYLVAFACTFNELLLFDVKIHGMGGVLGAFSVAVKQIMPDTILINLSFLRLKQDHLPLMLILIAALMYLIRLSDLSYLITIVWGVLIGWIYLRFFQKHKNGARGDSSSTFVFARYLNKN
jgi:membrane associated rhomboid family serine protease